MIINLMDMLFGCWHTNYSFPITQKAGRRSEAARATGTYVVCLECGKEFSYDWVTMKVVTGSPQPQPSPRLVEAPQPITRKQAA